MGNLDYLDEPDEPGKREREDLHRARMRQEMAEEMAHERKPLHGAVLQIDRRAFEQMLDLPVDVNVVGVFIDAPTASVILHLVGDALPEIPVGQAARRATLLLRHKRDDEGDWYQRVEFKVMES